MDPIQIFHNCLGNDHADAAAELVRNGAITVDSVDKMGTPVLLLAARSKCHKIARMLLDSGADIHAKTKRFGQVSAVHLAAMNSDLAMLRLLLEYGANMDARTDKNETAISHAVGSADPGGLIPIVTFLVQHGADINALSTFKSTPMDTVIQRAERSSHYQAYIFDMIKLGAMITRKAYGKANASLKKKLEGTFEIHEAHRVMQASTCSIPVQSVPRRLSL